MEEIQPLDMRSAINVVGDQFPDTSVIAIAEDVIWGERYFSFILRDGKKGIIHPKTHQITTI